MSEPSPPDDRRRADATRNRQTIIATARQVYGQRGLDAPIDEIARQAGVGNATVYRHFPSRCELVAAVFADVLRRITDAAQEALAEPDPWTGFATHVRFLCHLQATDRGLADLLTTEVTGAPELEQLRSSAYQSTVRLAERAKAAQALRADFVPEDLVVLLMANAGLVHRTTTAAPTAWKRFVDLCLDGLRTNAANTAAAPPGRRAIQHAMTQHGRNLGYLPDETKRPK